MDRWLNDWTVGGPGGGGGCITGLMDGVVDAWAGV